MATPASSRKKKPSRHLPRRRKRSGEDLSYGVPMPEGLYEAIEQQRDNLARAESLFGCLTVALEAVNFEPGKPYYPDVAQMALNLIRNSINGLDSLALEQSVQPGRVVIAK